VGGEEAGGRRAGDRSRLRLSPWHARTRRMANRGRHPGREPAALTRDPRLLARDPRFDARLARLRGLANLLDNRFRIPGTPYRFGIDPLIGLAPGVGDAVSALLATWLLVGAARLGAPGAVLARMGVNIAVDSLVGAIPLLGDLFDAGYKANVRNVALLEDWARRPVPTHRASRALVAAVVVVVLVAVVAIVLVAWKLAAWAISAVTA
jgi:hypothetical protein